MTNFVLDCSVSLSWFFKDEADAYCNGVLELLAKSTAWVPSIWKLEMANALLMAEKKDRISQAELVQAMTEIKLLPLEIDKDEPAPSSTLIDLARKYDLSVYDATYLDLAMRRGFPLASKDKQLISAAKKCGIQLLKTSV